MELNQADISFGATPGNDIRAFTGRISDHADDFRSTSCFESGGSFECPLFIGVPEATNGFFVHK
ncbi:MAG TPA: hypothetical protein VHU80_08780 [Polyangiaceae bacterium]|jgi:hypothetical protein|nr:hypothetical protein [Polyangiaceae bacterium]